LFIDQLDIIRLILLIFSVSASCRWYREISVSVVSHYEVLYR